MMADFDPLDPLAAEVRRQLGSPSEHWLRAQRTRLRNAQRPARHLWRSASLIGAFGALAVFGAVVLMREAPRQPSTAASSDVGIGLSGEALRTPYRLADGSTIGLELRARGRLLLRKDQVRFELQRGEAHFDVTHRPGQNWTVIAGEYSVSIVGTRFSVQRREADQLEVSVEQGVVSVRIPGRSDAITLRAGEQLAAKPGSVVVDRTPNPASAKPAATARPTASSAAGPAQTQSPSAASAAPPGVRSASNARAASSVAAGVPEVGWRELYRAGQYGLALAAAKREGVERLAPALGADALFDLADTARLGGDPAAAIQTLRALEQRYPNSPTASSTPFLLGRVYAVKGERDAAIAAFEQYLRRNPQATYANEAIGRLMGLYSSRGEAAKGEEMARRYLARAPGGPYHRQAASLVNER